MLLIVFFFLSFLKISRSPTKVFKSDCRPIEVTVEVFGKTITDFVIGNYSFWIECSPKFCELKVGWTKKWMPFRSLVSYEVNFFGKDGKEVVKLNMWNGSTRLDQKKNIEAASVHHERFNDKSFVNEVKDVEFSTKIHNHFDKQKVEAVLGILGKGGAIICDCLKWLSRSRRQVARYETYEKALAYDYTRKRAELDVPSEWFCPEEYYGSGDGCDCDCGAYDPDCALNDTEIYGCYGNNATCSIEGKCTYFVPLNWTCDPAYYAANDGCDCNCGVYDPDCYFETSELYGCDSGENPRCNKEGVCVYKSVSEVPSSWVCDVAYYDAGDGCDCSCGAPDPDCVLDAVVLNCPCETQTCPNGECVGACDTEFVPLLLTDEESLRVDMNEALQEISSLKDLIVGVFVSCIVFAAISGVIFLLVLGLLCFVGSTRKKVEQHAKKKNNAELKKSNQRIMESELKTQLIQ